MKVFLCFALMLLLSGSTQWTSYLACRHKLHQINLGNFESLVVIVQNGLKVAEHCIEAANEILGMINRTFSLKFEKSILQSC